MEHKEFPDYLFYINGDITDKDDNPVIKQFDPKTHQVLVLLQTYDGYFQYKNFAKLYASLFIPNENKCTKINFKDGNCGNVNPNNIEWYVEANVEANEDE